MTMKKLLAIFEAPGVGGYAGVPTGTTSNRIPKMASDATTVGGYAGVPTGTTSNRIPKMASDAATGALPAKVPYNAAKPATSGAPVVKKPAAPNYNSAVKSANAAFAKNQQNAAVSDANKVQADQTAAVAAANQPATSTVVPASTTPAPQANPLGIAPQANVPNALSPAPTPDKPAASQSPTTRSLPITTTGGPTAANPTSVDTPTRGGPAVTGGFGQETNMSTRSSDQIAADNKKGPMGQYQPQATKSYASFGDFASTVGNKITGAVGGSNTPAAMASSTPEPEPLKPSTPITMEEELEEELNELMRLSGQPMQEKAPPTAKGERMVKHIKQGYGKDGKLTDKEKGIAYATAWKAHNKDKVSESIMLEAGSTLEHIVKKFKHETKNFLAGNDLDSDLYDALYDYYSDNGEIPYGVAKARDGDPYQWVSDRFADEMQMHGYGRQTDMLNMPGPDYELTELARLAGLSESQVAECGDMGMEQNDSMNVSTNMSSDGTKSVNISAQGDKADALLQMLKMAGMRPHDDHDEGHEEVVVVDAPDEMMDEEYVNSPEEEYQTVDSIIRQGNDLNREKRQYADKPKLGDNPMAEEVELDEELQDLLDSVLFREEMTDVLKAEQPYQDEKTGKMVTPPKGATMPPPDSQFPPGDKRNMMPPKGK